MEGMLLNKAARRKMLEDFATTEFATDPILVLFTNDLTPDENTPLAALDQPEGDWYEAAEPEFGDVYEDAAGNLRMPVIPVQFNYSGTHALETVRGYALAAGDPAVIKSVAKLATPVDMQNDYNSVLVSPELVLPRQS